MAQSRSARESSLRLQKVFSGHSESKEILAVGCQTNQIDGETHFKKSDQTFV